jgi:hypothetical protein
MGKIIVEPAIFHEPGNEIEIGLAVLRAIVQFVGPHRSALDISDHELELVVRLILGERIDLRYLVSAGFQKFGN